MPIAICSSVSEPPGRITVHGPRPTLRGRTETQADIRHQSEQDGKGDDPIEPGRKLIDRRGRFRMIGDAEAQHRGIAEPEGQAGQKADLGDVDRVQSPGGIDPIAHRAAGENAGADIVSDRIAGEGRERIDAVGNVGVADRPDREQIIECQREITRGDEQAGQHDLMRLGVLDGLEDLLGVDAAQHVIQHVACDPDDRDADRNTQFMQDLLLAQQRDRPAYCFQHLDLELRSHVRFLDGGDRANCAAPGATLAPWCEVVARFGPEWNSLGVNKTRSFNILGGIR